MESDCVVLVCACKGDNNFNVYYSFQKICSNLCCLLMSTLKTNFSDSNSSWRALLQNRLQKRFSHKSDCQLLKMKQMCLNITNILKALGPANKIKLNVR